VRGLALGLVALFFALSGPVGKVAAQTLAFDLQTRIPGLSYGDLAYVRGTRVLPHASNALALDLDAIHRPFVVTDPNLGTEVAVVETRSTFAIMYGVGFLDHFQGTIAVPLVFQRGAGIEAFTGDPDDRLNAGAVGDLRLDLAYMPFEVNPALGSVDFDLGFGAGVLAPTGDGVAFSGSAAWSGYFDVMGNARWGNLRFAAQSGVRLRETATIIDVTWGSQVLLAGAVAYNFFSDHLVLAVEAQVLLGLTSNAATPAQLMGEARVVLDRERTAIVVGAGGGLNAELGAPEWQIVAAFRHTPGRSGSALARALTGEMFMEPRE